MSKLIYLVYSPEYNTGYVGKSCNLKKRYSTHCSDSRSRVKQFCIIHNIKPRDAFDIYEIKKCDVTDASYYEGHIYDLIQHHFPQIKLINKNKPNRSVKQWCINNAERCRANKKNWRINNLEHTKRYYKQWRENNVERCRVNNKNWRENNPEYHEEWRKKNPEYRKEYYQKQKLINK